MESSSTELTPEVEAVVTACLEVLRQTPSAVITDIDGTISDIAPTPAEAMVDPASVPALPIEEVNFRELHLALARAGYDEDAELNPATGVTVRLNAPTDPFGPPDTPQGMVYYVAIAGQGTVQDLFVSSPGWTIHSYQDRD